MMAPRAQLAVKMGVCRFHRVVAAGHAYTMLKCAGMAVAKPSSGWFGRTASASLGG